METVLLVIHLLLAVALIFAVLMQRTAQDGGGLTGGGSTMGGLFTARGSANLLTHATAILATCFIITSLTLGIIASRQHKTESLSDQIAPMTAPATPDSAAPATDVKSDKQDTPAETPTVPQVPVSK